LGLWRGNKNIVNDINGRSLMNRPSRNKLIKPSLDRVQEFAKEKSNG
jgi:hypothetical protein